jgi:hypothetical protein
MPVIETEPGYAADVVIYESSGHYSREVLSVTAPAAGLAVGAVLSSTDGIAFIEATGIAAAATHAAILLEPIADATPVNVVCIFRHAACKRQGMVFDAALTVQPAIETLLDGQGVIIRDGA